MWKSTNVERVRENGTAFSTQRERESVESVFWYWCMAVRYVCNAVTLYVSMKFLKTGENWEVEKENYDDRKKMATATAAAAEYTQHINSIAHSGER